MGRPRSSIETCGCEESTCEWDGSNRIFPLVRATAGRDGFRSVDRRSRGDQGQPRQEAEDRSERCAAVVAADAGRSLSADLGTQSRESRYAATAVAPAPAGADAYTN